ncbi:hypothetical protein [Paenibacillus sp. NEAU-GSW1]|uniref:Ig-like domain-containing protein n=1 Tax=Paenibacillus sp. NEAU-GSW1 TaxID=2682486 RepID=UPI0015672B82|nr:hypothetical protein [Paenibacillus sp. NEAU-GSW1]
MSHKIRNVRKWLAATLALTLFMTAIAGTAAYAAEETVTNMQFSYDSADYDTASSSIKVFVEDNKVELLVYATTSSSTIQKDVTADTTWKSSNTANVKVEKGVLTGVGQGSATISATYKGTTISIKATSSYVYSSVTLMQNDATAAATKDVELGQSLEFTLKGDSEDITDDAVWSTSSSSIATVENGVVTLKGIGTATITAKHKGKSDSIVLNVTSPYKSISISPEETQEMNIGYDDLELNASVESKSGSSSLDVTDAAEWSSSNTNIATVEDGVVTAVGPGTATINVSYKGVKSSVLIIVRTAYQAIKLTPEKEINVQLQDEPVQIQASVQNNDSTSDIITTDSDAVWTSSNPVAATVSKGLITPKAVGETKISVAYKGLTRSITVNVYPTVSSISVEEDELEGFIGSSEDLPEVIGKTFAGDNVDVSKLIKWTSSNETIAVIEDGKWTAKALGTATLKGVVKDKLVEVKLTVHKKPVKLVSTNKDISAIIGKELPYPAITAINEDGEEEDVSAHVTWSSSSDNLVLKKDTFKGIEASTVKLTAQYLNKSVLVSVKIEEEIVKITVEPEKIQLYPGSSKSVKVKGYYKSGKTVSLTTKMNWQVSNTNLATMKSSSSVKALQVGSGKLTGSYQGIAVTISIVVSPKLKSLVLSDKSLTLAAGQSYSVKLTANYTTGEPVDATESAVWTTSKSSVATVKDGKITAVGKGSATIKASFAGKTVTIRVKVK